MVGKINTSPRYMTEITGMDPLVLGVGKGRVNSEKLDKNEVFLTLGK